MSGWLRRMLQHFAAPLMGGVPRGRTTRDPEIRTAAPPLPLTRPELERTRPVHRHRLERADRVLRSYEEADGVLRLFLRRR